MRENLTNGSIPFRKAYLRSLIDVVEVDDRQIRIKGSKDQLERAVPSQPVRGPNRVRADEHGGATPDTDLNV